jgi:3'-phosphoadenosine 5'-phosphosulfate sulfotransferase (PAPS reductase)/FAD synthetase
MTPDEQEELNRYRMGYQGSCYACEPVGELNQKLTSLVRELFTMLDTVEESDSGTEFHPVTISCCRNMMIEPLNRVLREMKVLAR